MAAGKARARSISRIRDERATPPASKRTSQIVQVILRRLLSRTLPFGKGSRGLESPVVLKISSPRFPRLMTPVPPQPRRRRMVPRARILNAPLARRGGILPVSSLARQVKRIMLWPDPFHRKPILPHPRNVEYMRAREKQFPISISAGREKPGLIVWAGWAIGSDRASLATG